VSEERSQATNISIDKFGEIARNLPSPQFYRMIILGEVLYSSVSHVIAERDDGVVAVEIPP